MVTPTQRSEQQDDKLTDAIWQDPALTEALNGFDAQHGSGPAQEEHGVACKRNHRGRFVWLGGIAAGLVAGVVGWFALQSPTPPPKTAPFAPPKQFIAQTAKDVTLSDGSKVALNRQATLQFREDASERHAQLLKGEAYFDIHREPARPFTIDAGTASIRVLGTAFNVDKSLNQIQVDVFRGVVVVSLTNDRQSVKLTQGQRAKITPSNIAVSTFSAREPDWQAGWIELNDVSINDAVYQLNRYAEKPVIVDKVNRHLHVSGQFSAKDIHGAASLIASMHHLTLTEYDDSLVLTSPD